MGAAKSCSSWTLDLFQILQYIFFYNCSAFFPWDHQFLFFPCSSPSANHHVEVSPIVQELSQDSVFSIHLCLFPLTIIFFYQLETMRVFKAVTGINVSYSSAPGYALTHSSLASLALCFTEPPPCFTENEGSLRSSVTFTITNGPIFFNLFI